MKVLTTNFLTCAVKSCKSSPLAYPLHFRDAVLEKAESDLNPIFLRNILLRVDWEALKTTAQEAPKTSLPTCSGSAKPRKSCLHLHIVQSSLGFETLPHDNPAKLALQPADQGDSAGSTGSLMEEQMESLHTLLLETEVIEGFLSCSNCGHEYAIKEGIANFLLPSHLV